VFPQVDEDLAERLPERVHVEAVHAGADLRVGLGVVPAQPLAEVGGLVVRPQPGGPPLERGERVTRIRGRPLLEPDAAVDPVAVGPVPLDRDEREGGLLDQPRGEQRAPPVELVRAVTRVPHHHDPGRADPVEQDVEVAGALQRRGERGDVVPVP
jgi:hypothetical protein